MSLELDCRKFCLTYGLLSCQAIIVGVSGGADSMCLLDILYSLSQDSQNETNTIFFPKIIAAHINHGLRGKEADRDENLVKNYCLDRNIEFHSKRVDVASLAGQNKVSLEQAGRDARYSFFDELATDFYANNKSEQPKSAADFIGAATAVSSADLVFVAVAHHREDQAETILMNLFRGTGPDGLCGMKSKNGHIVRPLLFASKEEILKYLSLKEISFCEDLTNLDNTYTRNRFRNQVFPLVADVLHKDPAVPILAFSELATVDQEYFDEKVFEIFRENACLGGSGSYGLPCHILRKEHKAIASRLVRLLYSKRFTCGTDLTSAHVSSILALVLSGSKGRSVSLPQGRIAYLSEGGLFVDETSDLTRPDAYKWNTRNGQILLSRAESKGDPLYFFGNTPAERVVSISKTSFEVEAILVENPQQVVYNNRTWYCPVKFFQGAVLRTRRQGDWFSRADSTGGKPLRRFLTDRKIPGFVRDRMILVANESAVLWIPGVAHAQGFVDEISRRRYFESEGLRNTGSPVQETELYRITILDRNCQEEH